MSRWTRPGWADSGAWNAVRFNGASYLYRDAVFLAIKNAARATIVIKYRWRVLSAQKVLYASGAPSGVWQWGPYDSADYNGGWQMIDTTGTFGYPLAALPMSHPIGEWHTWHVCTDRFEYSERNAGGEQGMHRMWDNGVEVNNTTYEGGDAWPNATACVDMENYDRWTLGARRIAGTPSQYIQADIALIWVAAGRGVGYCVRDPYAFYNPYNNQHDVDLGPYGGKSTGLYPQIFFGGQQTAADWNAGSNQGIVQSTGLGQGDFTMVGAVTDVTDP